MDVNGTVSQEELEETVKNDSSRTEDRASSEKREETASEDRGSHPAADIFAVTQAIRRLDEGVGDGAVTHAMRAVVALCGTSGSYKAFIGKSGFAETAASLLRKRCGEKEVVRAVLQGLVAVTENQPALLTKSDLAGVLCECLTKERDDECLCLVLDWLKAACGKCDANRRAVVDAGCVPRLVEVLDRSKHEAALVRRVCGAFRALVQDDEKKEKELEAARNLENAWRIAECATGGLVRALRAHRRDAEVAGEVLRALGCVVARDEACERFAEEGGVRCVVEAMEEFRDCEGVCRRGLVLVKGLAGSERVRREMAREGAVDAVAACLRARTSPASAACANACVAALALRCAPNCEALAQADAPLAVLQAMREYAGFASVQKSGCRAIRNMACRCPRACSELVRLDAEVVVREAERRFPYQCRFDARAALRDLGCRVECSEVCCGCGCCGGWKKSELT